MSLRARSVALLLVLVAAACGDDDGGGATTSTSGGVTTAPAAPTELRVTIDGLTGAQDLIVVATVAADGAVAGSVCLPVTSDPFSGMGVVRTSAPDNPCSQDSPYGVPLTTEGTYAYQVATFVPGSQSPGRCATGEVTVDGPTEVVLSDADFTDCTQ